MSTIYNGTTYKIKRDEDTDIIPCSRCNGDVDTAEFSDKRLCVFCANSVGNEHSPVTKNMLAQMMHVLMYANKEVDE